MKNAKRTYTVNKMKGEIVKSFEEDIKVVYGDITFCEVFNPPLSTIRVYKQELGQLAVQKLIELIHSKTKLRVRTQICNELIKRGSIAPPQNE